MFERFTDRARKVMALANQEAQRFNHEYIATEHILLGLLKEGSGMGVHVLKSLEIEPREVRLELEKAMKAGPDMISMGKLPQTPRAKKVIEYAIEEARNTFNHNYVGTEHMFLGLVREGEGIAGETLIRLGVTLESARSRLAKVLGANYEQQQEPSFFPEERAIVEVSFVPGMDLSGFSVEAYTEVYRVDDDGMPSKSIGFFKDPTVAKAFADNVTDSAWHKTAKHLILTNGKVGVILDTKRDVKLFDDEQEAVRLRQVALDKLTSEDRALLGLE